MILRPSALLSFRRFLRIRTFLVILGFWTALDLLQINLRLSRANAPHEQLLWGNQRVYIASLHWNNEYILRSHWNNAVIELAEVLGPENVFITVYESGSWDNSKGALRELDSRLDKLGVPRNITLDEATHLDEISRPPARQGWIETPRGRTELRRIPYLARLRNWTLRPLEELLEKGHTFDKILFLNDVAFTTDDVIRLLNTNDGEYAAACSLDFSKPPKYYDTFALRDSEGHEHVMQTWPFFRAARSRDAMKKFSPVPVASCWNGMVSMDAKPFISERPLRFRGISDSLALSHLEGSECCLIHADNPLSSSKGIYLNPNVRVGYSGPAYDAVHPTKKWLTVWDSYWALWKNRLRRWTTTPFFKEWVVRGRVQRWRALDKANREPGEFCLINEMQVLVENGWAHV